MQNGWTEDTENAWFFGTGFKIGLTFSYILYVNCDLINEIGTFSIVLVINLLIYQVRDNGFEDSVMTVEEIRTGVESRGTGKVWFGWLDEVGLIMIFKPVWKVYEFE